MKKWMQTTVASLSIIGMLASGSTISAAPQKANSPYRAGHNDYN